jgi:hypothetical protein
MDRQRIRHWTVLGLTGLALALYWLWSATGEWRAVRQIPPEERAALQQGALEALRTVCARGDPALDDYCRAQARLLLDLPECDAACRELAARRLGSR